MLDDSQRLARQLKYLRERSGLDQLRLAQLSGVNHSTISKIESGDREPRVGTILKLAAGLGLNSLEELFGPLPSTRYEPFHPRFGIQWEEQDRKDPE